MVIGLTSGNMNNDYRIKPKYNKKNEGDSPCKQKKSTYKQPIDVQDKKIKSKAYKRERASLGQ